MKAFQALGAQKDDVELIAGRYRLESLIAQGGVGAVWKAHDLSSDRVLALKRMLPEAVGDKRLALLFQREYHTLALLKHPRIIEVHDYGVSDAGPYYTMELLDGVDLGELSPIPYRKACHYLRDVASSLALLHSRRLLHRDLSPRNVRCTSDDRCKLLDFGTMATFGVATEIVGTPPLVPPEALRGVPLDHRADLYSLGALAYRVLTRRHAYRAQRLEDLPELFRRAAPPPPSALVATIPPELDALVLSLLQLDPILRPGHVFEVIDRLTVIGNLPPAEDTGAAVHSFLARTHLVGRDQPVERIKGHLQAAIAGHGTTVVIEGNPGVGKTRLLEEASLHAQLMGCIVLGVEARRHRGPNAVSTALARKLMVTAPEDASLAAQPYLHGLSDILRLDLPKKRPPTREQVQRAMCDWFSAISQRRPLVLLIDDVHRTDEPSAAFLSVLAQRNATLPLLIIATRRLAGHAEADALVQLLVEHARRVRLHRLPATDTIAFIKNLFGDVPNSEPVARHIHEVTSGNPAQIIAFCEHLVERNIIRYSGGLWVLPTEIAAAELPKTVADAMIARINALPPKARGLAVAASVHRHRLSLELLVALAPELPKEEVFRQVDILVEAGIFEGSDDGYSFGQDALRDTLRTSMNARSLKRCHEKLGRALLASPSTSLPIRIEAAFHLLRSGDELTGATMLAETAGQLSGRGDLVEAALPALEAALNVLEREKGDAKAILRLRTALVMSANRQMCERYGDSTLELLAQLCGVPAMEKVRALGGATASLATGLGAAYSRHLFARGGQRGVRPVVALTLLYRMIFALLPVRSSAMDAPGLGSLRRYVQVLTATPTMGHIADALVSGVFATVVGDYGVAQRRLEEAIRLLRNHKGNVRLPTESHRGLLAAAYITRGLLLAQISMHSAEVLDVIDSLNELRQDPQFAGLSEGIGPDGGLTTADLMRAAQQIRVAYHLGRGETELARIQMEHLAVEGMRAGLYWQFDVFRALFELRAAYLCRDLAALRRSREQLRQFEGAEGHSDLVTENTASAIELAHGRLNEALALSDRIVKRFVPGSTIGWDQMLLARGELLRVLGNPSGAAEVYQAIAAACQQMEISNTIPSLLAEAELAHVEAQQGQTQQALSRMDRILARSGSSDNPLLLTRLHSAAAAVSAAAKQVSRCQAHVRQAQHWASLTRNTALLTQAQRLDAEFTVASPTMPQGSEEPTNPLLGVLVHRTTHIESVFLGCTSDQERARRALQLILESATASAGHLFLVDAELRIRHAAQIGTGEPQDAMEFEVARKLSTLASADGLPPLTESDIVDRPADRFYVPKNPAESMDAYLGLLLQQRNGDQRRIVAVAVVLGIAATEPPEIPRLFLDTIAECLTADASADQAVTAPNARPQRR